MWTSDRLGTAVWRDDKDSGGEKGSWYVDARGGDFGIGVIRAGDDIEDDRNAPDRSGIDSARRFVSLNPVDQDFLPHAEEQFVRGNRLQVNYPQGDSSYAIRLAIEPIESGRDLIVLEMTVSIQTDLLDTHPQIDLDALCIDIDSLVPSDSSGENEVSGSGSAPISIAKGNGFFTSVLLGPHDSPFTTNHSTDSRLRLRLFGDFLEKGVIRKARPWIVIDRSGQPPDSSQLQRWWEQLCGSPLPLTP